MEAVYVGTPVHVLMELFAVYPEASKPTCKDGNGDGFFHILISNGYDVDILRQFVDFDTGGLKSVNKEGFMPLHLAISLGKDWDIIALLLERHKAAASTRAKNGQLPLHMAIQRGAPTRVICALLICFPQGLLIRDFNDLDPRNAIGDAELEPLALIALFERSLTYWAHYAHQLQQSNSLKETVDGAVSTLARSEANNPKFVMEQTSQRLDELESLMNSVGDDVVPFDENYPRAAMLEDLHQLMGSIKRDLGPTLAKKDSVERTNNGLDEIAAILSSLEQHHLAQLRSLNVNCQKMVVVESAQDDVSRLPDSPVLSGEDFFMRLKLAPSDECTSRHSTSPNASNKENFGDDSRMDVVEEGKSVSNVPKIDSSPAESNEGASNDSKHKPTVLFCDTDPSISSKIPISPHALNDDGNKIMSGVLEGEDASGDATLLNEGEFDDTKKASPALKVVEEGENPHHCDSKTPIPLTLMRKDSVNNDDKFGTTHSKDDGDDEGVQGELNTSFSSLHVSFVFNTNGESNEATNLREEGGKDKEVGVEVRATGSLVMEMMRSQAGGAEQNLVSSIALKEKKGDIEASLTKNSTGDTDEIVSSRSSSSLPAGTFSEEQDLGKTTKLNISGTELPSNFNKVELEPKPSDSTPDVYLKDCFVDIDLAGPVSDLRECEREFLDFSQVGPTQEELEELYRSKVRIETQTIMFVKNIASVVSMCKADVTVATNVRSADSGETLALHSESEQEEVYQPVDIEAQENAILEMRKTQNTI